MTGQAAFARTLRALDADSFRVSKLALLVAVVLLAVWSWWFFTPSIMSRMSETVTLQWDPTGHAAIINPTPEIFAQIRKDQPAQLHFGDRTVSARIVGKALFMLPYESRSVLLEIPANTQQSLPTRAIIEIETGRISPATVVLRALHE